MGTIFSTGLVIFFFCTVQFDGNKTWNPAFDIFSVFVTNVFFSYFVKFQGKPLELFSVRESDQAKIRITIKKVGTCEPGDFQNVQVFNIIMRECMKTLKLEEIRRNYYDPAAKVCFCTIKCKVMTY